MRDTSPLVPPTLRADLPVYPGHLQLLRVTPATVPGPTGGTSAGVGTGNIAPTYLYIASTQQLRTDTLAPRDREPCLVDDVSGFGLLPGYYLGRLAGSHNGLPVYEVTGGGGATFSSVPTSLHLTGLTAVQLNRLTASLTPEQLYVLDNLDPCQLQVLLQIPITNISQLTGSATPQMLQNLVDRLTYTQLINLITTTNITQQTVISSAFPPLYQELFNAVPAPTAVSMLTALTSQQTSTLVSLTAAQLQVISQLPLSQLQILTNLTPLQVTTLVGNLTAAQLTSYLTGFATISQLVTLTNALTPSQIEHLIKNYTPAQILANLTALTTSPNTSACCRTYGTVTAAGNSQSTATEVVFDVATVNGADGTKGIKLIGTVGRIQFIKNAMPFNLLVYPPSNEDIDGLGTNNPDTVAGTLSIIYHRVGLNGWFSQNVP